MQRLINDAYNMAVIIDGRLIIGDIAIKYIGRSEIFDLNYNRFFEQFGVIF